MPKLHCDAYAGGHSIPIMNKLVVFDSSGTSVEDIKDPKLIMALQSHNPSIQPIKSMTIEVEPSSYLTERAMKNNLEKTVVERKDREPEVPVIAEIQQSNSLFVSPALNTKEESVEKTEGVEEEVSGQSSEDQYLETLDGLELDDWEKGVREVFPRASFAEMEKLRSVLYYPIVFKHNKELEELRKELTFLKKEDSNTPKKSVRIFEVARQAEMKARDFLEKLNNLGYNYKTAQNAVRPEHSAEDLIVAVQTSDLQRKKRQAKRRKVLPAESTTL